MSSLGAPPGKQAAKLIPNSCRGIFLGCVPCTTRNILWCDPETSCVKIATHACFNEGFNDLPITAVPPNVMHLHRTDANAPLPIDASDINTLMLCFCITPFAHLEHLTMKISKAKHQCFGFQCVDDKLLHCACIKDISPNSNASCIASTLKALRPRLRGNLSSPSTIVLSFHLMVFIASSHMSRMRGCANQLA